MICLLYLSYKVVQLHLINVLAPQLWSPIFPRFPAHSFLLVYGPDYCYWSYYLYLQHLMNHAQPERGHH